MWWTLSLALANPVVPVQGTLADSSGAPANGTSILLFSLWTTPTGGSAAWTEGATVQLSNGHFAHALGATTALDLSDWQVSGDLWLSVTWNGVETSRVPIGYAARALHATNAEKLGGKDPSAYTYQAGAGLDLAANTFTVAASEIHAQLDPRYRFTAGDGLDLAGTEFSVAPSELYGAFDTRYQPLEGAYTAGPGVQINGTEISGDPAWFSNFGTQVAFTNPANQFVGNFSGTFNGLRLADNGGVCNSGAGGTLKFSSSQLWVCDGTSWKIVSLTVPTPNVVLTSGSGTGMNVTGPGNPAYGTPKNFVYQNIGLGNTAMMSTAVTNATNFEITADTCNGVVLTPNSSCSVTVRPRATTEGALAGALNVTW